MIMTKEALKKSYSLHHQDIVNSINNLGDGGKYFFWVFGVLITLLVLSCIKSKFQRYFGAAFLIGIMLSVISAIFVLSMVASSMLSPTVEMPKLEIWEENNREEIELNYKINNILPYLFKNEETANTLKRYEQIDIQIDQDELLNTGAIIGKVVVDDNGKEIIYPFKQITLGVTSSANSYLEVNELDVALSKEYPLGKAFNVLYLNTEDYTMFVNLFGEIPIRVEK